MRYHIFFAFFQSFFIPVLAVIAGAVLYIVSDYAESEKVWDSRGKIAGSFDKDLCRAETDTKAKSIIVRCKDEEGE